MLEIKNVSKTYRPKKGVPVKALDDVSLKFEDRGMVFILGKSGSGKSTLLNVLGGLDTADSGEFIIKEKSSNDFSQSDFDSYRNTFIGFIFQEYNILSEFSVGANIALAMELQGKKATNEELTAILDEVDLTGYGNRKPNELSGGQKQRVAIARALIKKPEIIMADEPTGALDSKTGKQVFDTLKKLSKEKLVLIVSHDREFAEKYADRIIELKDGKILSDVSKTSLAPTPVSNGVSVIDGGFIKVKKGYKLTQKDLALIAEYIEKADTDALISLDGTKAEELNRVAGINDDGGKDVFSGTDESKIKLKKYAPEDSKLIRSKLPFKNSLKIGASSLKTKPIRLIFTIFLCFVAFTLFGIADTMASYNRKDAYIQSIADSQTQNLTYTKTYHDRQDGWTNKRDLLLTDADIASLSNQTGVNMLPVYAGADTWSKGFEIDSFLAKKDNIKSKNSLSVYNGRIGGYAEFTEANLTQAGISLVKGVMPQNDYEIAIPKFIFDQFALAGFNYTEAGSLKTLNAEDIGADNYDAVIGKSFDANTLQFPFTEGSNTVKIVGIYDTHFDTTKYADFMPDGEQKDEGMMDMLVSRKLTAERDYGYHTVVAVNQGMIAKIVQRNKDMYGASQQIGINTWENQGSLELVSGDTFNSPGKLYTLAELKEHAEVLSWVGEEKTALAEGEIIAPYNLDEYGQSKLTEDTINALLGAFGRTMADLTENEKNELQNFTLDQIRWSKDSFIKAVVNVPLDYIEEWATNMGWLAPGQTLEEYMETPQFQDNLMQIKWEYTNYLLNDGYETNEYDEMSGKQAERKLYQTVFESMSIGSNFFMSGTYKLSAPGVKKNGDYTIVGYYFSSSLDSWGVGVSDAITGAFGAIPKGDYMFALGAMPFNDTAKLNKIVDISLKLENDIEFGLQNETIAILGYINDLIETLSEVFLYIGIGFAVFAALMMFNFISVSINQKKREIGILRAVGARSGDVFGIFLNESMIITLINFVLSAIATGVVCFILNGIFRGYGMPLTILSFGLRQIGLLLGLGVAVAFIGSFIPVMRIAKKRPIDAIQNR